MDSSHVTWRKATYSGANGGDCVEVGVWRKSTHSGGNGGDCVEVASTTKPFVAIRDSKDPSGPMLSLTLHGWQAFTRLLKKRQLDAR